MTNELIPEMTANKGGEARPPAVYAAVLLGLIGLASASVVYAYLDTATGHTEAPLAAAAAAAPQIGEIELEASAAIVLDTITGDILYERESEAQLPLASLTKVATALAVSEVLSLDETIVIPYDTAPQGAAQRLGKGERWSVKDVITFTLVSSSNLGAQMLADAANTRTAGRYPRAPKDAAVVWRMNDIARELGLIHTYFLNVSGLDISMTQAGSYGSAGDVARLFAFAASTSPELFSGTTQGGILLVSEQGARTSAFNTNEALGSIPGLMLGKTGYTDLARGNLAVVFDAGIGHPIVAVVLGSSYEGRFTDMRALVRATRDVLAD